MLNKVASWISSYPVYGDAIIASVDMTCTTAATLEHLKAVLQSSLPTGLWTASNAEKFFLSLPSWYYPTVWDGCSKDSIAVKKPSHILQEILSRRSEATGFSKLELPCASHTDHDDDRSSASLVYEDVPLNGWWSKGVEALHVDSSKRTTNNPEVKKVHASKGELIKLQITLPHSEGLFSTSGRIFSSSEEVEKGSAEASEISQGLCLDALLALQSCGMEHLNHLPSYLRPYLGSLSEEAVIPSALPPSSSSSIHQSYHSPPSTPSVQSNELGEDSNEDGTEGPGEGGNKKGKVLLIKFRVTSMNTRDSTTKRKSNFQDSQMIELDRNDSMAVTDTSLTMGVNSSQESTHTDEERSPKKIRYETISGASDARGAMDPMTPSTISTTLKPVEAVNSTAEYQETSVTESKGVVAVNEGDYLTGPGYTMSAFSGMGMLPKGLELELSTRPLGEIFTVSFPGDMGACVSGGSFSEIPPSSSSSSSSALRTPTAAGSDVVAVMENGHMSSTSSSSSTVRDVHVTDYAYEIKVLERRIHDSQPINKKAKPNLFYPSLSTQVSCHTIQYNTIQCSTAPYSTTKSDVGVLYFYLCSLTERVECYYLTLFVDTSSSRAIHIYV